MEEERKREKEKFRKKWYLFSVVLTWDYRSKENNLFLPHLQSFLVPGFSCSQEEDGLITSAPSYADPGLQQGSNNLTKATERKKEKTEALEAASRSLVFPSLSRLSAPKRSHAKTPMCTHMHTHFQPVSPEPE